MKNKKGIRLLIVVGAIFFVTLVFLAIGQFSGLFIKVPLLSHIGISSSLVFAVAFAISLAWFVNQRSLSKTLQMENEYNFGVRIAFNNLYAFQKRVEFLTDLHKRRKRNEHIIAFTFSSLVISQNVNRNNEIYSINHHIADFLEELPNKVNCKRRDFVFAFSRGAFLICVFKQNEQSIQKMCEIISEEIYAYAEENCRHIWVQPFFCVTIV